jgi:hypothetical protein
MFKPSRLQVRFKFYSRNLPADAPKQKLDDGSMLIRRSTPETTLLAPLILPKGQSQHKVLTEAEKKEIQALRLGSPLEWTVTRLAKKFGTSKWTILELAPLPKDHPVKLQRKQEVDTDFKHSSLGRQLVLINRIRRKSLW